LKKGDLGGLGLPRFGKIPPTPLYKGGIIIYGQVFKILLYHSRNKRNNVLNHDAGIKISTRMEASLEKGKKE
jgi:hypothetical protein